MKKILIGLVLAVSTAFYIIPNNQNNDSDCGCSITGSCRCAINCACEACGN